MPGSGRPAEPQRGRGRDRSDVHQWHNRQRQNHPKTERTRRGKLDQGARQSQNFAEANATDQIATRETVESRGGASIDVDEGGEGEKLLFEDDDEPSRYLSTVQSYDERLSRCMPAFSDDE